MTATTAFIVSLATLLISADGFAPDAVAQDRRVYTVLTIHWGPEEYPATPIVNTTLRDALTGDPELPVDYFSEYLESDMLPAGQASAALANYLQAKYRGRRIDLVIAVADPALRFVLENRDMLFANVPIVYSGVGDPASFTRDFSGGITGILRGSAYQETVKLALQLHPSTRHVFVVAKSLSDDSDAATRQTLREASPGVPLTFLDADAIPDLLSQLRALPSQSVVLFIAYSQKAPWLRSSGAELMSLVADASPAPVYGTNEWYIGRGAVGGMVRSRVATAGRMAAMAMEILRGRRPEDIPVESARLAPVFDWRQLERHGIDASRLPAESEIRFRPMPAWAAVRPYAAVTLVVFTAQLALIAGLLRHRAQRRRAERGIRMREASLRTSFERIRRLTGRLIDAQESTRAAIARDLHDDVCQDLAAVAIGVSSLQGTASAYDAVLQEKLSRLKQTTLDVLERVRRLSQDLHPSTLRVLGLAAALRSHCLEVEKRHDVQVSLDVSPSTGFVPPDAALCLFRIAQEALRNSAVHGQARRINIGLSRIGDDVELVVADDGCGFDVETAGRDGSGLGLISIEERVHLANGRVEIMSQPWDGTTIKVRVPAPPIANPDTGERPVVVPVARTVKAS